MAISKIKAACSDNLSLSLSRVRRKVKFEMETGDGDKISIVFEGSLNREKLFQLADFLELIGGPSDSQAELRGSKLTKVVDVIEKHFPFSSFTSRDVADFYQYEYREPIPLSTVSTYLARLAERGYLERSGAGNLARYRVLHQESRVNKVADV